MDAYGEMILELAKHPLHKERLQEPTVTFAKANTSCGDSITVDLLIQAEIIQAIGWQGKGCAISQAAMSIVADECTQKSVAEVQAYSVQDITKELGIPLSARRLRCAELGLLAVQEALQIHSASQ